jgi:hypothetical protein
LPLTRAKAAPPEPTLASDSNDDEVIETLDLRGKTEMAEMLIGV